MRHIAERGDDWSLGMRNSAQGEREYGGGQRSDQRPQCEAGGHGPQEQAPWPAERFGRAQQPVYPLHRVRGGRGENRSGTGDHGQDRSGTGSS